MNILKHPEDQVNYWRGWTCLPILLLPAVTGMPEGVYGIVYGLLIWFVLNDINFLLHQHVHYPLTRSTRQNAWLDWLMSFTTAMCAYSWRQQHIFRHHMGNDTWGAATRWEYEKPSFLRASIYAVRKGAAMYWYPLVQAINNGIAASEPGAINYRRALLQHAATNSVVVSLIIIEPSFYLLYYFFVYFFTTRTDYDNHVGCDDSEFGFSNNTFNATYNAVRNNFGFHTAHHYYPQAHWTQLPHLHEKLSTKIPPRFTSNDRWTGFWTPPLVIHILKRSLIWLVRFVRDARFTQSFKIK